MTADLTSKQHNLSQHSLQNTALKGADRGEDVALNVTHPTY